MTMVVRSGLTRHKRECSARLEGRRLDVVEVLDALSPSGRFELLLGNELPLEAMELDMAVAHQHVGVPFDQPVQGGMPMQKLHDAVVEHEQDGGAEEPPTNELSFPMIAFCTVFDRTSRTTRSNGLSWPSSVYRPAGVRATETCTRPAFGVPSQDWHPGNKHVHVDRVPHVVTAVLPERKKGGIGGSGAREN